MLQDQSLALMEHVFHSRSSGDFCMTKEVKCHDDHSAAIAWESFDAFEQISHLEPSWAKSIHKFSISEEGRNVGTKMKAKCSHVVLWVLSSTDVILSF